LSLAGFRRVGWRRRPSLVTGCSWSITRDKAILFEIGNSFISIYFWIWFRLFTIFHTRFLVFLECFLPVQSRFVISSVICSFVTDSNCFLTGSVCFKTSSLFFRPVLYVLRLVQCLAGPVQWFSDWFSAFQVRFYFLFT
jgi:hypothetical protein